MSYALGLDIGCTNVKTACLSPEGAVLARGQCPTPASEDELLTMVRAAMGRAADERREEPRWVGISAPGLADGEHRAIAWMSGRNESVVGVDWGRALDRRVWVLNDGHAAALGEAWIGAAAGRRDVVLLTLGTGVGGGILLGGRLLTGRIGRAGHLGHVSLDPEGEPDICSTPGSLESAIGEVTLAERSGGRFHSTRELVLAAAEGDAEAEEVWGRSLRILACALASLVNILDPEVVVLGGGIAEAGARLFEPLARELERVEWRPYGDGVAVLPAALGSHAGAIGAARFAMLDGRA